MAKVNITAICMNEVVPSTDGLIVPSEDLRITLLKFGAELSAV